jgi:hypothetical protein
MAEKKKNPKVKANVKRVAKRIRATSKARGEGGVSRQDARAKARKVIASRPKASKEVRKIAAKVRKRRGGQGTGEGTTRQDARAQAHKILAKKRLKAGKGNSDEGKTKKRKHKV